MPSRSGTRPSTLLHMHARPAPKEGEGGAAPQPRIGRGPPKADGRCSTITPRVAGAAPPPAEAGGGDSRRPRACAAPQTRPPPRAKARAR
mmetsp:Transcript_7292/g.22070  ORF Transcript_7292/g.22070 Transcript_7292/m.22070 type:complete len:90 (-) Transcript_7292:107-376(-)